MNIGTKVRLNKAVAAAFVGQLGTIESIKSDPYNAGKSLYVVRLETPTAPAKYWSELQTLAVGAHELDVISYAEPATACPICGDGGCMGNECEPQREELE